MITRPSISFQRDSRILLDTGADPEGEVESVLRRFAELTSAAGNLHSYSVTEMSLWAAAASGRQAAELLDLLRDHASSAIPHRLSAMTTEFFGRYGLVRMRETDNGLCLVSEDVLLLRDVAALLERPVVDESIPIAAHERGYAKALLADSGYPVRDEVLSCVPRQGDYQLMPSVELRAYQRQAVDRYVSNSLDGGLILLPCGAGKTVVGVAVAAMLDAWALIVTPNRTIGEQWAEHFERMTTLAEDDISLFTDSSGSRPITIVTYQALTGARNGILSRLHDAADVPWGLVVYDEVHTLPADVFRQSAALQARRRLGLTATLVREDGREREVFALVGPPVWQSRWRDLEHQGWISPVECFEVRIRSVRPGASKDSGLAAKISTARRILDRHRNDRVLIAAHRLKEIHALSKALNIPAVTGETSQRERSRLYNKFRSGELPRLIVSRVANVGVDLPDANVLIQVSGTFGSRLEEAQRLGRLLRPKPDSQPARFYTLILPDTRERAFAERRQRFLVDQGYRYQIVNVRG